MPRRVVGRTRRASYLVLLACVLLLAGCTTQGPAEVAGNNRAAVIASPPAHARARTRHHRSHHRRSEAETRPAKVHHAKSQQATTHQATMQRAEAHQAGRHQQTAPKTPHVRGLRPADLPDHGLTPGVVLTTSTRRVCTPGYASSVRDVPTSESDAVYARYGVVHVAYAHEVDHLVSLELGGSNAIGNLWPEPYAGRWGARTKDVLENRLHELVCGGQLSLRRAQRLEARNWVAAYRRFVGGTPTAEHEAAPSAPATTSSGSSGNGSCEPGYSPCLPVTSDLDCGDIPDSEKPIRVTGSDPYRLDGDGDGYGCE